MPSKSITLKGAAASALVRGLSNQKLDSEEDELQRIAAAIHIALLDDAMPKAVALLRALKADAAAKAAPLPPMPLPPARAKASKKGKSA